MKNLKKAAVCVCVMVLVILGGRTWAAATLPFADGFEGGSWSPSDPWSASGGLVDDTTVEKFAGSYGCIVSNASLTLGITPDTYSNVWIQFYAKPATGDDDPEVSNVSGAFYLNSNGKIRVYDTNGWTDAGSVTFTPGQWIGLVVHVDYGQRTWDLYYWKTGAGGNTLMRLNSTPFRFPEGASNNLFSVVVESGNAAYLDAVAVSRAFRSIQEGGHSPAYVRAYEFPASFDTNKFNLPVYSSLYTNAGGNNLVGAVGMDLFAGLRPNDEIILYEAVNNWGGYRVTGSGWANSSANPPNIDYTVRTIEPTDVIRLDRHTSSAASWGFFAYDSAITVEGEKQPTSPPYQMQLSLYGTSGGHSGFTALNWPREEASLNSGTFPITDAGGANLSQGDRLYKANPATPDTYREFWWDDNAKKWMRGNNVSSEAVPGAANMWIKRQASGAATVNFTL